MGPSFNYLLNLIILSSLFLTTNSEDLLGCKEIVSKSPLLRIKRHLFCEYDKTVRPILSGNATINVTINLMPKFMDFNDYTNTFTLHSWLSFTWVDEHLKWNAEDFDGVNDIRVKSTEIWVPDFSVYNSGDMESPQNGIPSTDCILYNSGKLFCVPATKYITQCLGNYAFWPYDKQNCTIIFGSWSHTGEEIDFVLYDKTGLDTEHFTPHPLWNVERMNFTKKIIKYDCCPNDTYPSVILEINLVRQSRMIQSIYVTPAIVLLLITLTIMWLDSRSNERIILSSVNFICHLLVIYDMHWIIPFNGINIPHIIIFYRNSLLLATLAIISTMILRKLQDLTGEAPNWIKNSVSLIMSCRAAQFIFTFGKENVLIERLEENTEDSVEELPTINDTKKCSVWRQLAIIIERSCLVFVFFTYIIMLIVLIPFNNHWDKENLKSKCSLPQIDEAIFSWHIFGLCV